MATTVYSTPFVAVQGLTSFVTVPVATGFVYVVRDLDAYYNPSSFTPLELHVVGDGGQTFIWTKWLITDTDGLFSWRGRQVITGSFTVTSSGPAVDVTISGYKLSLP